MTDATKCRPLKDRVLVQRLDADNTTTGGVIIPSIAKKRPSRGIVLATGPDVSSEIAVGDEVVFERYAGHIVDDDTLLMDERELVAKVVAS